jgi:hypothetical protein
MDADPKGGYVYYGTNDSLYKTFHMVSFSSTTGFGQPSNITVNNNLHDITAVACDPAGQYVLIGDANGDIYRFDGSLVSNTPVVNGLTPITSIVFNRTNSFVYMSGTAGSNFKIYQFSYSMGGLNQQPSLSGNGCNNLVIDPTDKNLYGNSANQIIHVCINSSNGTLSNENGIDAQGKLALICGITVDQDQNVYVTNSGVAGYQAFSLIYKDSIGDFQVISQSSGFSGYPSGIACVPNGKYVYVPQGSTGIQIFDRINGSLTPKSFVSLSDGQPFIVKIVNVVQ